MRWMMPCLMLALTGCDTPGPGFRGVAAERISVGKSMFDIRVRDGYAEAIRLNPEWAPRLAAVAPRAVRAIETVSACRVHELTGDQAQMVARLDCGSGPPPAKRRFPHLECELEDFPRGEAAIYCMPVRY